MESFLKNIERYFNIVFLGSGSLGLGKVLASQTSINILEALAKNENGIGMTAQELSEKLDMARTTALYHLSRLQESGLIELNPALSGEAQWNNFWESYKHGRSDISQADFNRIHGAKMKGEKLFLPTNRSVLLLPTANIETGEHLVRKAFLSVSVPPIQNSYNQSIRGASVAGILGLMLLAVTFFYSPFMQPVDFSMTASMAGQEQMKSDGLMAYKSSGPPSELSKARPEMALEDSIQSEGLIAPDIDSGLGQDALVDKGTPEKSLISPDEEPGYEISEAKQAPSTIEESDIIPGRESPSEVIPEKSVPLNKTEIRLIQTLKYFGVFLVGLAVAFIIMGYLNRTEILKGAQ